MKCHKTPRNGVAANVRKRIPCEETRHILWGEEACERSEWNRHHMLATLTNAMRDDLFLLLRNEAKSLLAVRYPFLSSKARHLIVTSVREEGQPCRRKARGGGFHPYGSEGPAIGGGFNTYATEGPACERGMSSA